MNKNGQFMSEQDARPFKRQHQAPCSDCPWARKAIKGWTGPNSAQAWLRTAHDYWHRIACHTRLIFGSAERGHWECAGAAIYRANVHVIRYEEKKLLVLPANKISVFATPNEFLAHHGRGLGHE